MPAPPVLSLVAPRRDPQPDAWSSLMLRIARHRDENSFLQLYDHFAPRLLRHLRGLGAAPQRAEDLVQESMLRAWRSAHLFDARRASVATWLFRIARNLHIDAMRRGGVEDLLPQGWEADDDAANTPEAYADHVGLARAIQALPPLQARLVRMSFLEARSHGEIAGELGMPLGSVKSSLRRAFSRLQRGYAGKAA